MIRNDYLMRQIKQLTEAIARMVGLSRSGKGDEARRLLDAQYSALFGLPRSTFDRLDARSALMLVGSGKGELLLRLVEAEAEILRASGDPAEQAEAARREARADALRKQLGA